MFDLYLNSNKWCRCYAHVSFGQNLTTTLVETYCCCSLDLKVSLLGTGFFVQLIYDKKILPPPPPFLCVHPCFLSQIHAITISYSTSGVGSIGSRKIVFKSCEIIEKKGLKPILFSAQRSYFNMLKNRTISNEIIIIADRYTYPRARTLEHPFQSPPCLLWVVPATPHPVACRLSEGWHLSPRVPSFLEEKGNEIQCAMNRWLSEMTLQKVNGNWRIFQDLWSVNNCAASQCLWNNIREAPGNNILS